MTTVSKNVQLDVTHIVDHIVDKHNNANHRTIKMKPIDVTSDQYAGDNENSNEKDLKFKVSDRVRISKYKNIFAKRYTQKWSEEVSIINKIKNTIPWTYITSDLNGESITGSFCEKGLQKTNPKKIQNRKNN